MYCSFFLYKLGGQHLLTIQPDPTDLKTIAADVQQWNFLNMQRKQVGCEVVGSLSVGAIAYRPGMTRGDVEEIIMDANSKVHRVGIVSDLPLYERSAEHARQSLSKGASPLVQP